MSQSAQDSPETSKKPKAQRHSLFDRDVFAYFSTYLRPHRRYIGLAIFISLFNAALEVAAPTLVEKVINGPGKTGDMRALAWMMTGYLALLIFSFLAEAALALIVNWTGQTVMMKLRNDLFTHLQSLDTRYYDKNPVGRLLTRVMNDVSVLNDMLAEGIPTIFKDLLMLLVIVIVLFVKDWRLAAAVFICFPIIMVGGYWFSRMVRKYYRDTRVRLAELNGYLQENISGMPIVQLFGREKKNHAVFSGLNARYRDSQMGAILAFAVFFPIIEVVSGLAIALILWHSGVRLISNDIEFGTVVAFVLYTRLFFMPIRDLAERFNVFESALAGAERIFELVQTEPAVVDPSEPKVPLVAQGRIEFENVWFAYSGENWVLRDVSFTIEAGMTAAIVGATGAGKSTLTNLIMRLYDVQKGSVKIDGIDVREMRQNDLRRKLAVVLQDVFLFHGTIAENIRLARPGLTDEEMRNAAVAVHADTFIRRMPKQYDSAVLERGATLSTGQKQLLAFARALACDPEILILDEATSNIDTETERLIQDALARLLEGRTALVIAHRLSTIQRADRIFVFHHGKLREQGTHDELLRQEGIYYRLSQLQYIEDPATTPAATVDA